MNNWLGEILCIVEKKLSISELSPWQCLKGDTHRYFGSFRRRNLIKGFLSNRTFRVVITLRFCQCVAASSGVVRIFLPFFKVLHRLAAQLAGVDLLWRTDIGAGFQMVHGWGLVVNPDIKIGSNVTLFHGVTLGRRDRISPDGSRVSEFPTLEDEVWVGPHAIVVGGVTIGKGSRIAGGAFVTDDVPPYSVVSGNPATVVKNNCIPDVMNPAPL